jgi:quinol monooxygenase YgiN
MDFIDNTVSPVVFINIFTVKPGCMDEFIALQQAHLRRSRGIVPGWRGSRLHRGLDGITAIMVSTFDSIADHQRVHGTERFAEHVVKVRQLMEKNEPGYFLLAEHVDIAEARSRPVSAPAA